MKRGVEYVFLLLVILIILSIPGLSFEGLITPDPAPQVYKPFTPPNPTQWKLPTNYPQIISSNPFMATAMSAFVLPEFIPLIPPALVNPKLVLDKSKLTYDQLMYGDNYNKVEDKSKLNQNTRDKVLAKKTGQLVTTVLRKGTKGKLTEYGFRFDEFEQINIGNIRFSNGTNFEILDNIITIDYAEEIIINNIDLIKKAQMFMLQLNEFDVSKSELVSINCFPFGGNIDIPNVENTNFKVGNVVEIKPGHAVNYSIKDCSSNNVSFSGDENSKLSIDKNSELTTYYLEKGSLTYLSETISTNSSAYVSIDPNLGFVCMTLGIGTGFTDNYFNYSVVEPMDGTNYSLCLRKEKEQDFEYLKEDSCIHCGLIDFLSNQNILKGRIILKRLVNDYWLNVFDSIMAKIEFTGLTFIDEVKVDEINGSMNVIAQTTNFYLLKENKTSSYLNELARLLDKKLDSIIKYYKVVPYNSTIEITDNVMNIDDVIFVYPKNSIPLEVFLHG